jgi:hypothetical protein
MSGKQFKKIRRQQKEDAASQEKPGVPISQLPPNTPGERLYRMVDKFGKEEWIEEKNLTREQMAALAKEFWQYFMYLPVDAQEIFIRAIDKKIEDEKMRVTIGNVIHDVDKARGMHEGNVSEGGIILPNG